MCVPAWRCKRCGFCDKSLYAKRHVAQKLHRGTSIVACSRVLNAPFSDESAPKHFKVTQIRRCTRTHTQTDGQSQRHRGHRAVCYELQFPTAQFVVHPRGGNDVSVLFSFFFSSSVSLAIISGGDYVGGGGGSGGVRGLSNPKAGRGFREKRGGEQKGK